MEIKEELEIAVRCFVDSFITSKKEGVDQFDKTRILESAFNRLFLAVEHLTNAMMLKETGNYSKKHFGDWSKLENLKEKYKIDLQSTYQETDSFRAYADYRKFPEVKEKFDKKHLEEEIQRVKQLIESCLSLIKKDLDINYLTEWLKKKIEE